MTIAGDLAAVPVTQLLGAIRQRQATCQLVLRSGNEDVIVYVQRGQIIRVTSSQGRYRLGDLLVQLGLLSAGQLSTALEQHATQPGGRTLGAMLASQGLVTPNDLVDVLTYQAQHILSRILTWRQGTYQLVMTLPEIDAVPLPDLNIAQLIGAPVQAPPLRRRSVAADRVAPNEPRNSTMVATLPADGPALALNPGRDGPALALNPGRDGPHPEFTSRSIYDATFAELMLNAPVLNPSLIRQEPTMTESTAPDLPEAAVTAVDDLAMTRQLQELCTLARHDLSQLEYQLRQLLQQIEGRVTVAARQATEPPRTLAAIDTTQLEQIVTDGQSIARLSHSIASRHRLRHQLDTALSLIGAEPRA